MNPLVLILMAILPLVAFVIGVMIARMNSGASTLSKEERQELSLKRELVDDLTASAGEHIALGDNYAVVVQDYLAAHRRDLARGRKEIR